MFIPMLELNTLAIASFMLIFTFLVPILLYLSKRKFYYWVYLSFYFVILLLGVTLDITITYKTLYINILITKNWFSNSFLMAHFSFLTILINIFLLFPFSCVYPMINHKTNILKLLIFIASSRFIPLFP